MGMYTEFHFNARLRQNVPEEVLAILNFMLLENKEIKNREIVIPEHPLFETTRWKWMLLCDSYYYQKKMTKRKQRNENSSAQVVRYI